MRWAATSHNLSEVVTCDTRKASRFFWASAVQLSPQYWVSSDQTAVIVIFRGGCNLPMGPLEGAGIVTGGSCRPCHRSALATINTSHKLTHILYSKIVHLDLSLQMVHFSCTRFLLEAYFFQINLKLDSQLLTIKKNVDQLCPVSWQKASKKDLFIFIVLSPQLAPYFERSGVKT